MSQPFLHKFLNDLVDQIEQQRLEGIKNESIDAESIPDDNDDDDDAYDNYDNVCQKGSIGTLAYILLANYLQSCIDRSVIPAGDSLDTVVVLARLIDDYS